MQTTRSNNGNYVFLRFTGTPAEVRQSATKFFNFGVLATMPEFPDTNAECISVIATTYRHNVAKGLLGMATAQLMCDRTRTRGMKGRPSLFHLAAEADALAMLQSIPLESTIQRTDDARTVSGPAIDETDNEAEGLTPSTRAAGRRILAHFFGSVRDSAKSQRTSGDE